MRKIIYFVSLFALLASSCSEKKHDKKSNKSESLVSKNRMINRSFRKIDKIETHTLDLIGNFFSAYQCGANRSAFVSYNNQKITVVDKKLNIVKQWGEKGRGPSEFQGISQINYLNSKNISVIDERNRKILFFDSSNRFIKEIPYDFFMFRGNFKNDSTIFAVGNKNYKDIFFLEFKVNINSDRIVFNKNFIRRDIPFPKEIHPILANASTDISENYLIMNLVAFGKILILDLKTNKHSILQTIDYHLSTAKVIKTGQTVRTDRKATIPISMRAFINNKKLYVWAYDRSKVKRKSLLDIYSLADNSYLYSIKFSDISLGKIDRILIIKGNAITVSENQQIKKYVFKDL